MAKKRSKKTVADSAPKIEPKTEQKTEPVTKLKKIKNFLKKLKTGRPGRVKLHKSFRRSYREDYNRELEVPGLLAHAIATFKMIFKNWKIFLCLIITIMILNILLVGLMSESTYREFQEILDETNLTLAGGEIGNVAKASLLLISTITTGGLSGESSESAAVFAIILFLITWLTTIFILRHRFAGHKIKLRDALYNAMTPIISTLVVFLIILIQCIPIIVLVIIYSVALVTDFLSTPFYALVFFIFASAMILWSGYLISGSLMGLVSISAPGLYPLKAIHAASDLMAGRRVRFIIRLLYLFVVLILTWVFVALPLILIDLGLKSSFEWLAGFPFVPLVLLFLTCFTMIYIATYLYLYYRWMLNYDED